MLAIQSDWRYNMRTQVILAGKTQDFSLSSAVLFKDRNYIAEGLVKILDVKYQASEFPQITFGDCYVRRVR